MKIAPLLRDLLIGSDAAENDTNLEAYFVRTATYWNIVGDQADVILGAKGSGKSAIARRICSRQVVEQDLDMAIDVLPAFNLQGAVAFRKLGTDFDHLNEASLRVMWMAYVVSLVGNHLVKNYPTLEETRVIRDALNTSDLLDEDNKQAKIWDKILDLLRRIAPRRIEAQVSLDPSGAPVLGGSAEFGGEPQTINKVDLARIDWQALLQTAVDAFVKIDRKCWVVFDRLDEAFPENRALERSALRALLRAHLDISSYGAAIRSKLFLRTDLLDRITVGGGFVNATHMRRMTIEWEYGDVADLIARRVMDSKVIVEAFSFVPEQLSTPTGRQTVISKLLPREIESADVLNWVIGRTSDATEAINPRNVVTLLRLARNNGLLAASRDSTDFQGSLLMSVTIRKAWAELSRIRLQDTIYAEFNQLRPYLEKLTGRYSSYSSQELANWLGLSIDSEAFRRAAIDLKYAGIMRQSSRGTFTVPLLYRPALRVMDRGKPGSNAIKRRRRRGPRQAGFSELEGYEPGEGQNEDEDSALGLTGDRAVEENVFSELEGYEPGEGQNEDEDSALGLTGDRAVEENVIEPPRRFWEY